MVSSKFMLPSAFLLIVQLTSQMTNGSPSFAAGRVKDIFTEKYKKENRGKPSKELQKLLENVEFVGPEALEHAMRGAEPAKIFYDLADALEKLMIAERTMPSMSKPAQDSFVEITEEIQKQMTSVARDYLQGRQQYKDLDKQISAETRRLGTVRTGIKAGRIRDNMKEEQTVALIKRLQTEARKLGIDQLARTMFGRRQITYIVGKGYAVTKGDPAKSLIPEDILKALKAFADNSSYEKQEQDVIVTRGNERIGEGNIGQKRIFYSDDDKATTTYIVDNSSYEQHKEDLKNARKARTMTKFLFKTQKSSARKRSKV